MSDVVRIKKTNAATVAIIDQRTVGMTNLMAIIAKNVGIVSLNNVSAGSAPARSMVSGVDTTNLLILATMTEKFLGGGSTAGGGWGG